jgi:hypothetical protein
MTIVLFLTTPLITDASNATNQQPGRDAHQQVAGAAFFYDDDDDFPYPEAAMLSERLLPASFDDRVPAMNNVFSWPNLADSIFLQCDRDISTACIPLEIS